jgi:3-oxoacyl-[acyl-carrier protein] reductase
MVLEGKNALITGAGRGIGAGVAALFVRQGARVYISDVDTDAGIKAAADIGGDIHFIEMDVSDENSVKQVTDQILNESSKIDILVNNAGITNDKLLLRMTIEDWSRVLSINLTGTFLVTKAVMRGMIKQRFGRIMNIASVVGLIGNAGQANYAASKAGIIGFTKSCAKELAGRNITVNAIAPGFIETRMTEGLPDEVKQEYLKIIPMGRFGQADDIAHCALFLASDRSSYITGQVFCVDGGMVM